VPLKAAGSEGNHEGKMLIFASLLSVIYQSASLLEFSMIVGLIVVDKSKCKKPMPCFIQRRG
jgi:hypothetical protein